MNETVLNLMKKELRRLTKAYEKAKKHANDIADAPTKYIELNKKAIALIQKGSIESTPLLEIKKQIEPLKNLMKIDYCAALDKEFDCKSRVRKMQEDISLLEYGLSLKRGPKTVTEKNQQASEKTICNEG